MALVLGSDPIWERAPAGHWHRAPTELVLVQLEPQPQLTGIEHLLAPGPTRRSRPRRRALPVAGRVTVTHRDTRPGVLTFLSSVAQGVRWRL